MEKQEIIYKMDNHFAINYDNLIKNAKRGKKQA